jgi:MurNAc alpha-1-phosphate uridylyltransferase
MPTTPIAVMLLAAGRGERMRPLTDICPKPLLKVGGKPLLQWQLEAMVRGGLTRAVVNTAWLGDQIEQAIGNVFELDRPADGGAPRLNQQPVQIGYSREGHDFGAALETAGGIVRALPLLCPSERAGADVFWLLAGDVFVPDFSFSQSAVDRFKASGKLAHLWLVPNPVHNPRGDFGLSSSGLTLNHAEVKYTYSTIGLYRCALFAPPWCGITAGNPQGLKAPLAPLLRAAMDNEQVSAELYQGAWTDVGTPQRLAQLNEKPAPLLLDK